MSKIIRVVILINSNNELHLRKMTRIYIVLMISVYLLFAGVNTYSHIMEAKFIMFFALSTGYILVTIILCKKSIVMEAICPKGIIYSIKNLEVVEKCLLFYLVITWMSAIASDYFPYTIIGASRFEGAITISLYIIICLLISKYGVADKTLLIILSVSIVVFDIICILQLMDLNPLYLFPKGLSYSGADVDFSGAYIGTIGNVDLVGAFFSIVIPILIISILKTQGKTRLYLLVPVVLCVYVLFQIKVYSGIVSFSGMILASAFVYEIPLKERKRILCIVFIMVILFGCILYFIKPKDMLLYQIHEILRGNLRVEFGTYRVLIWERVLNLIPDCPILGHGPDTMIFGDFGEFVEYDLALGKNLSYIDVAHNEYLNVLYHQGVLGLMAFLGCIIHVIIGFVKNGGKNSRVTILGMGLICYSIQAFFGISMFISAIYFWICLGLFLHELKKGSDTK